MKKLLSILGIVLLCVLFAIFAQAADFGTQRSTTSVTTNAPNATPPIGDTGRFTPETMFLTGPAGVTATVQYVVAGYTGAVSSGVVVASAKVSLAHVPKMFFGDYFKITSSELTGTNAIVAVVQGEVFD